MVMLPPAAAITPPKLSQLRAAFLALTGSSCRLAAAEAGLFDAGDRRYTIPRFSFSGPPTSGPQKRIGLFALVHGDEPAGAYALLKLLQTLVHQPDLAAGYDLISYPVCNPTGFEDDTRYNRAGFDLNREFWCG